MTRKDEPAYIQSDEGYDFSHVYARDWGFLGADEKEAFRREFAGLINAMNARTQPVKEEYAFELVCALHRWSYEREAFHGKVAEWHK
jgi:hypothetical protein